TPDFAIAAYFNADLSMRSTPSLVASLARIASFRSESTRSCSVMRKHYLTRTLLSMKPLCQSDAEARAHSQAFRAKMSIRVDLFREALECDASSHRFFSNKR